MTSSGRSLFFSYISFVVTFSAFVFCMLIEAYPIASIMLIVSGMMLAWVIECHRRYRVEKKIFYYDILSPYPASMRKGVERPFLMVIDFCDCDASSQSTKKEKDLSESRLAQGLPPKVCPCGNPFCKRGGWS